MRFANPSDAGRGATHHGLAILVVDDDQAVRAMLCRILDGLGHRALEASNGISGLRILETTRVDIVVTDVVMPDMEGLEFVRRIRRSAVPSKIIVMSGGGYGAARDYLDIATLFGADATLAKPFSADELGAAVQRIMFAT